jgi:hypothetical protein
MILAFSAACSIAIAKSRAIARSLSWGNSLPRRSMAQLIQPHVEREAIERGTRDDGNGMIVHEEEEFIGARAMIDPWFGFEARIEKRWTRLR